MSRPTSTRTHSVVEPHPSVVKSSSGYIGSGRGGAGNFQRYQSSALSSGPNASGPAALTPNLGSNPKPRVMPAGRGGAGNMFRSGSSAHEEPNIFQFDEELIKRRESAAPVYHIGRGGAANWGGESKAPWTAERKGSSDSSASVYSDGSSGREGRRSLEGALGRLQRRLTKQ
ncbi:hypothetical protein LTR35_011229 [Friedmanniomyces endolithicus]|uniref:Uncharacterized protein n=1 Tax=Friedmanniomyces endolithicus TaxID=329885 RepID=A0AAN6FH60_9PEZI|nr:hypothetical protein LTR35_011229 [Friedmanniomyces endolithicus]KAK0287078.1 hypothetical protein LTS00_010116 [Friedmanniomyces endolithicus]KAK0317664.1 hypothetical protein LTR82_011433 [Friedmanniomyces endolithicus]KAK0994245.1 hypothetical protein LTR54_010920 [Friedmanniomyces endolithicus]KAK1075708.1 hypothetical protein LTR74_000116 [Friedmanniomyces endolithicus]